MGGTGRTVRPRSSSQLVNSSTAVTQLGLRVYCLPRLHFEVTICDLKAVVSSVLSWNIQSAGKWVAFLLTA
jgi:hypothetical protein